MSIEDHRINGFPRIHDTRGNLAFVEDNVHVPFDIKRMYCLSLPLSDGDVQRTLEAGVAFAGSHA
jgi:WxcM-like, C-terminal